MSLKLPSILTPQLILTNAHGFPRVIPLIRSGPMSLNFRERPTSEVLVVAGNELGVMYITDAGDLYYTSFQCARILQAINTNHFTRPTVLRIVKIILADL
jgi:hypothetical protein